MALRYEVVYSLDDGRIISYTRKPEGTEPDALGEGYERLILAEDIGPTPNTHSVDLETEELVDYPVPEDPYVALADWVQIKKYRELFEQYPIDTPHGTIDADLASMERLRIAIKQFLFLPTVQDGKLAWKMADNTIKQFTYTELQGLYEEADRARSVRAAYLHVKAEHLAAMEPPPTVEFISDINNWIEP